MSGVLEPFSLEGRKVFVTGHTGMAGAAIVRRLAREKCEVLTAAREVADLRRQDLLDRLRPDVVVIAAARVGGIKANNDFPVDFLADNLAIQTNLLTASHLVGVDRLLFLGSTCIYPRDAPQPLREDSLMTGPLEPTNEWYAIAKIAGLKLAQAYRRQYGRRYISSCRPISMAPAIIITPFIVTSSRPSSGAFMRPSKPKVFR